MTAVLISCMTIELNGQGKPFLFTSGLLVRLKDACMLLNRLQYFLLLFDYSFKHCSTIILSIAEQFGYPVTFL